MAASAVARGQADRGNRYRDCRIRVAGGDAHLRAPGLTAGIVGGEELSQQQPIARVLCFVYEGQMVLLHGFIKKTQQTPEDDLDLAVKRQKEVESGKAAK
jgi:phage-related protein